MVYVAHNRVMVKTAVATQTYFEVKQSQLLQKISLTDPEHKVMDKVDIAPGTAIDTPSYQQVC